MNKKITNLKIENLKEFKGHPFKVVDDWDMVALTESIRKSGVINPVVVRPIEGTENYEIISGHRRIFAAKKLGLSEVPALIYSMDKDTAIVAVVDSNFNRENILPSEKAFAYKMRNEALKRQNKDSVQVGLGDQIAMVRASESASQIKRYVRLTKLNKQLLDMVDEGKIAFTPAVELSFLNDIEQNDLLEVMEVVGATPNLSQAMRLKEISQKEGLTPESISEILSELKANQRERLHIQTEKIRKFFPKSYTLQQMEDEIIKLCEKNYRNKQKDAR
ncbi:MAG: ParB/RepB/Spo0J family partition protein [Clostridia bacterium]|nr:ParB/RepB/Spo0J family partition protein [Clostridia bacterium]